MLFPVPLQYFIPSAKKGINRQIELAILRADKMGVKVISLAALNKVTIGTIGWLIIRKSCLLTATSNLQQENQQADWEN